MKDNKVDIILVCMNCNITTIKYETLSCNHILCLNCFMNLIETCNNQNEIHCPVDNCNEIFKYEEINSGNYNVKKCYVKSCNKSAVEFHDQCNFKWCKDHEKEIMSQLLDNEGIFIAT